MFISIHRAFLVAFFFAIYIIFGKSIIPQPGHVEQHNPAKYDARCAAFPDPGNIAVAVRTGATNVTREQLNRVATIFNCLHPDRLVFFSDLDQTIGPYRLHDALSDISPDLLKVHHDFTLYRKQKKMAQAGLGVRDIQEQAPILSPDMPSYQEEAVKNMDKYKFLHMVKRLWDKQPDKQWYVFADASSYYVWPGLVRYLREQDPTRHRFYSKADRVSNSQLDIPNGETGFILSGTAVKALVESNDTMLTNWDAKLSYMENGQHGLAEAIYSELNLTLTDTWPIMIGEPPARIPFQITIWCEPVVALANVSSELALRLLAREQAFTYASPREFLTFKDVFEDLYSQHKGEATSLPGSLSYTSLFKWDNLASEPDTEWSIDWRDEAEQDKGLIANIPENPNYSMDDCARACNAFRDCMQFSHMSFDARWLKDGKLYNNGGVCYLSRLYRFGAPRAVNHWENDGDNGDNPPNSILNTQIWNSGWHTERWKEFSSRLTESCNATM